MQKRTRRISVLLESITAFQELVNSIKNSN